jgi:hypothetical protein
MQNKMSNLYAAIKASPAQSTHHLPFWCFIPCIMSRPLSFATGLLSHPAHSTSRFAASVGSTQLVTTPTRAAQHTLDVVHFGKQNSEDKPNKLALYLVGVGIPLSQYWGNWIINPLLGRPLSNGEKAPLWRRAVALGLAALEVATLFHGWAIAPLLLSPSTWVLAKGLLWDGPRTAMGKT